MILPNGAVYAFQSHLGYLKGLMVHIEILPLLKECTSLSSLDKLYNVTLVQLLVLNELLLLSCLVASVNH